MESDVREKILETARCIFLKEGYKGTTINSIARAAGISPSTIYLHFNGKKDLFENLDISEEEALQDAYNANRTSILQTALILFGEHGYDGVSMDMLARESGYSKATLYQYFKDKEELYSAVMQETPFYFNFLSIQPEIDGYDLEAAIKRLVWPIWRFLTRRSVSPLPGPSSGTPSGTRRSAASIIRTASAMWPAV